MRARQTCDGAARPEDAKRLLAAFDIAWKAIAPRVGDHALAWRLVTIGNSVLNFSLRILLKS